MELSRVGEFGLIDRLRAITGEPAEGEVWIGDDAAVLRAPAGTILFTTDLLVEHVHFDTAFTGPEDLGYKCDRGQRQRCRRHGRGAPPCGCRSRRGARPGGGVARGPLRRHAGVLQASSIWPSSAAT